MGIAIYKIEQPNRKIVVQAYDWQDTQRGKYDCLRQALAGFPPGSLLVGSHYTQDIAEADQLGRLLGQEEDGLEEVNGLMLAILSQMLTPYNRFQPTDLARIQEVFGQQFEGQERYFWGKEAGSDVLYVGTPWTFSQMLLETDVQWSAAKYYKALRFWRCIDKLGVLIDEVGYKTGREWRYRPTGMFAHWSSHYQAAAAMDVFEQDNIVFRFWWD